MGERGDQTSTANSRVQPEWPEKIRFTRRITVAAHFEALFLAILTISRTYTSPHDEPGNGPGYNVKSVPELHTSGIQTYSALVRDPWHGCHWDFGMHVDKS